MQTLWTLKDINDALGLLPTGKGVSKAFSANGISLDSRTLQPGDLFLALKGPHYDGSSYVEQAFEKGAAAAVLPQENSEKYHFSKPCFYVENTTQALQKLAAFARLRTKATVVAVTGSFGKTGTKDALKLILESQGSVTASERSFNNHWGVPLTLGHLNPQDDYGVIEIGMNHPGEIATLSRLARPHVALITNVRAMHLQGVGSLSHIAKAKSEIFEGMSAGSTVVLNGDDETYAYVRDQAEQRDLNVISFGSHKDVDFQLLEVQSTLQKLELKVRLYDQICTFSLPSLGEHWALNVLGILGVIDAIKGDIDQAICQLQQYQLPEGRGQRHRVPYHQGYLTVIDESYNAGPDSMKAALKVLGSYKEGRRIAILGDMNEIGEEAVQQHQNLCPFLLENQVDLVFAVGPMMKHLYEILPPSLKAGYALEVKDLVPQVLSVLKPSDVIMSKGSKGQYAQRGRMYAFVEAILKEASVPEKGSKSA